MEFLNNVLFECLWEKTIEEIVNPIYDTDDVTEKIILILAGQKLSRNDYQILEENSWSILEVEAIMKDATDEELQNYILAYFSEVERLEKEFSIICPENNMVPCRAKPQEENLDSFLS